MGAIRAMLDGVLGRVALLIVFGCHSVHAGALAR